MHDDQRLIKWNANSEEKEVQMKGGNDGSSWDSIRTENFGVIQR